MDCILDFDVVEWLVYMGVLGGVGGFGYWIYFGDV